VQYMSQANDTSEVRACVAPRHEYYIERDERDSKLTAMRGGPGAFSPVTRTGTRRPQYAICKCKCIVRGAPPPRTPLPY
jgi:hypothetical protein